MNELRDIWVYLSASPLLHLTLTLLAFQLANWIYHKGNLHPLLNPVLITVALLATMLVLTETPYQTYFDGAQFVHFLLGPATVALAIPLHKQFQKVRRSALAIVASIVGGSLTASVSAVAIGYFLNGSPDALLSLT